MESARETFSLECQGLKNYFVELPMFLSASVRYKPAFNCLLSAPELGTVIPRRVLLFWESLLAPPLDWVGDYRGPLTCIDSFIVAQSLISIL